MAGELNLYKILTQHLVDTGFRKKYNELVDLVIFDVENDGNGNLVFDTNTGNITVPIPSNLDDFIDVNISGATSGDVLTYNGSNWIAVPNSGGDLSYIRPATSTRDGFTDVSSITSVVDALDKILYPFVEPTFNTFAINSKSSTLELGQELITTGGENVTFAWSVTEIGNISNVTGYDIIDVTNANTNLSTNILPNTTTSTLVNIGYQIVRTTVGSYQFKIQGTDTQASTFSKTKNYSWNPRRFWGTDPTTGPLDSAEIIALTSSNTGGSQLSNSRLQTRTMDGNGEYIYFSWLESLGDTSGFIVGGLPNSAWTKEIVSFTNGYGHTDNYITYRTNTVQFGTNISIQVT